MSLKQDRRSNMSDTKSSPCPARVQQAYALNELITFNLIFSIYFQVALWSPSFLKISQQEDSSATNWVPSALWARPATKKQQKDFFSFDPPPELIKLKSNHQSQSSREFHFSFWHQKIKTLLGGNFAKYFETTKILQKVSQ